jgi:hypothetical protein
MERARCLKVDDRATFYPGFPNQGWTKEFRGRVVRIITNQPANLNLLVEERVVAAPGAYWIKEKVTIHSLGGGTRIDR